MLECVRVKGNPSLRECFYKWNLLYVCMWTCAGLCVCVSVYTSMFVCVWVYFGAGVYVAISWQEQHMNSQVLWVLCFRSWHTYSSNMTMEPPQIDQHLFCLETRALENGPDSYTPDPDWSSSGPLLYLAGAISFYSFERTCLSGTLCICMCVGVCVSVYRDLYIHIHRCSLMGHLKHEDAKNGFC